MKTVLFVPSVPGTEWVVKMFPGRSPAELPVGGRRIIDYCVERAAALGYDMVEILDWHYSETLAADFASLTAHETPVFYVRGTGDLPQNREDVFRQATPLTQNPDGGTMVVWGLELGKIRINDVKDWLEVNFAVMHDPGEFVLPCYSAEKGVYLGRNVVIEHGCKVERPVLMCDNTWLARNVVLDGNVVIGTGSFVGEGARLKNTVVGRDTYIGCGLELENKIVIGFRIIDPESGAWTDVEEPGIARRIGGCPRWIKAVWRFLIGTSHGGRFR